MKGKVSLLVFVLFLLIVSSACTVHTYSRGNPPPRYVYATHYHPPKMVYMRHSVSSRGTTLAHHNHYHASASKRAYHSGRSKPFYHQQKRRVESLRYLAHPERGHGSRFVHRDRNNHDNRKAHPHQHRRFDKHEARRSLRFWPQSKPDHRSKKNERSKARSKRDYRR